MMPNIKFSTTLSIIIPVHNQAAHTSQCLSDFMLHCAHRLDTEWILVDNGSTDQTAQIIRNFQDFEPYCRGGIERLKVIKCDHNKGFGPANNMAALEAKGKYLLLLNNDIRLSGDICGPIIQALDNDSNCLYGVEMLDRPTGWNTFQEKTIHYLAAWCLALTKDVFWALGGFDDIYQPAYFEDVDLCHTAEKKGYKLNKLDLPVTHISGQTGMHLEGRDNLTRRNRCRFAKKHGYTLLQGESWVLE